MEPPDRPVSRPERWEPWPLRSDAEVVFLAGEQAAAERIARRLFQRTLDPHEYASLAGAPDDAKVEVGALDGMLYLEMGDPATAAYRAYYYVCRAAGRITLRNEGFHIHLRRLQSAGFGLQVFFRQARNAVMLGVDRITAVAGRSCDENGYYTWPRFGFNGRLPQSLRRILPTGCRGARDVLAVMESEEGRRWWREHGDTVRVTFDLTDGSRSRKTLREYVASKNFSFGPKRNLASRIAIS
jgi:hypothetical protein